MKYVIIFFLFLFSSCSNKDNDKDTTLRIALSSEISTLDPANSYDTISANVVYQGYEQLYEYHYLKRPYSLKPLLAKEIPRISDDGKTYTIKLKENILYHDHKIFDGEKRFVTADDFVTQIKRLAFQGTQSNGWWLFDGKIVGLNEFREKAGHDLDALINLDVEGLKAKDDHTLIIKLTEPFPQMTYALAMSFTSPIPEEAVIHYDNILDDILIGTGPYELVDWQRGQSLKMERFNNYHVMHYPSQGDRLANSRGFLEDAGKQLPFVQTIDFNIIKENNTRWNNFLKKDVDFLAIPKENHSTAIDPSGRLTRELQEMNLQLQVVPSLTYWWLSFNMNDPLLGENLYLRKAIAHAIDRSKYVEVFTNNIGQEANSIYPPGVPGYDPASRLPYDYNLEKAAEYLKKAGYPNGEGLEPIKYNVRGASATNEQQAQYIKSELEKIGIEVEPVTSPFPVFLQKARAGELQFWLDGWAMDYPDAENILQLLVTKNHSPGPNATFYSNEKFDELFEELRFLPDGEEKEKVMNKLESMVYEDLPWIMLYYSRDYILQHEHVKNYRHSDIIYNYAKYVRITR